MAPYYVEAVPQIINKVVQNGTQIQAPGIGISSLFRETDKDTLLGHHRVGWVHISWVVSMTHGKQTLSSQMEQ